MEHRERDPRTTRPECLYKYHSASRVAQILRDLTFYFAPVSQLNDLFEFRVRSLYSETPDSKYRVFAKRLVREGWFDSIEEALTGISSGSMENAATESYSIFIQHLNAMRGRIMQHSGVVCFSAHRNNQRMWATYGDNHSGAVIEFSTASDRSRFAAHTMPVLYFAKRFELCPSEFMTRDLALDRWLCGALCCIKHWHWRDEAEWRLLMLADSAQSATDRVVAFERSAITRVFLGPRMKREDEALIRELAASRTPEIPVFNRRIDDEEAKEELVGIEHITTFEQLKYWADRCSRS